MTSIEVPSKQWLEFCDTFSREHSGWPITIEILSDESGVQRIAEELPLQGLSFDTAGTRPATLQIAAGDQPSRAVSHAIELPLRIRVAEENSGQNGTIQVEQARGPMTLVYFHQPN